MFNPTNLDEVCVQDMHIEYKAKSVHDVPLVEYSQEKEGKEKGKGKDATTMRKCDEMPACFPCQKKWHRQEKCWVLHP